MTKEEFTKKMQTLVEKIASRVGAECCVIVLHHKGKSGVYVSTHEECGKAESASMMRAIAKEINHMANAVESGKLAPDGCVLEEEDEPKKETPNEGYSFSM